MDYNQTNKRARILVIDDEESIRGLLKAVLSKAGHTVLTAEDGEQGIAVAEESRPDIIFMDITMPGMSGYEVTERLKKNPDLTEIPVVFLSGKSAAEDGGRAFARGGLTYARKPISPRQVTELVALTLESISQ